MSRKIYVYGREGSGKKTFKEVVENNIVNIEVVVLNDIQEVVERYNDTSQIYVIESPTICCYKRLSLKLDFERYIKEDVSLLKYESTIKYVTELQNITIVDNSLTIDHFRRQIKTLINKQY